MHGFNLEMHIAAVSTFMKQQQQQQILFGRSRKQSNYKTIKLKLLLTGYQRVGL